MSDPIKVVRKETDCIGGKHLVISDSWRPGTRFGDDESVVFELSGPRGGCQGVFGLSREDAGDLGRFLVEYYGEGQEGPDN